MQNTLPALSTNYLSRTSNKYTEWKPEESVPPPNVYEEVVVPVYAENKMPVAAPNERMVEWSYVHELEVSPLCESERGVTDKPIIQFAKVDSKRNVVSTKHEFENFLVLKMVNTLPTSMDLFVQNMSNMSSCIVGSDKQCLKAIAGNGNAKEVPTEALTSVLFSTMKQISVSMTTRQEIKDFVFKVGVQIGLELEMDGHRLICSKVLPDCQASPHEIALDGAEIIAVNGVRVTTIDSFKEQMYLAQENDTVTLKMASYKGGRGKHDDLYHKGTTSTVKVISLLSNIMKTGIDRDHQHDIELPSSEEASEEKAVTVPSVHSSPARRESAPQVNKNRKQSRIVEDLTPRDGPGSKHSSVKFKSDLGSDSEDDEADDSKFEYLEDQKEDDNLRNHSASNSNFIIEDADGIIPANAKAFIIESDHNQIEGFNKFNAAHRRSIAGNTAGLGGESFSKEMSMGNMSAGLGAMSATNPATSVTNATSEEESSRHSADDDSTNDSSTWNYATALPTAVFPFTAVVCVPPELSRSLSWGYPRQHIQFSNYSSSWNIEVNWLDEDSALVPRTALNAGSIHFELCSTEHVWVLIATRNLGKNHRGAKDEDKTDTDGFAPDQDPVVMMFRPTYSTMMAGRCTSILWSPWSSMSICQRLYAKQKKGAGVEEKSQTMSSLSASGLLQQSITPYIHVQVFDGVRSEYNQRQNQAEEKNPLSNAVKLPNWRKQKQRPPAGSSSSRAAHK